MARKDRRAGGCAIDARGVGIAEIHSALGEGIDVGRDRARGGVEAADPIVHVIDRDEEDVGLFGVNGAEGGAEEDGEDEVFHGNADDFGSG